MIDSPTLHQPSTLYGGCVVSGEDPSEDILAFSAQATWKEATEVARRLGIVWIEYRFWVEYHTYNSTYEYHWQGKAINPVKKGN